MKARLLPIITLFLLTIGAAPPERTGPSPPPAPVLPVSQVQRGMTGYGITALGGDRPERFDVEVLGVLRGWGPKGDIVMVRMSGPIINEAGGFSGMSGSPVYIEDKLLGAVAYGWPFTKIPLAGVTPAEEMMKVPELAERAEGASTEGAKARARQVLQQRMADLADLLMPGRAAGPARVRQAADRISLSALAATRRAHSGVALPRGALGPLAGEAPGEIRPLPLPLAVGGLGGELPSLSPLLEGTGMVPVQAAEGGGRPPARPRELEPGIPVGVAFVTGDMDVSGMGTLTWIKDGEVLAFGHPMFGAGRVDLPMAVGYGEIVVPSLRNSFRISNTGRIIGRITQDRDSAIAGELGGQAPMFPCSVRVRGLIEEDYHYRVAGFWQTAPLFAYLTVQASSVRWQGSGNPYHLSARAEIRLNDRDQPLALGNDYSGYSVLGPPTELVMMPLSVLTLNPFREVEIEGIDFELEVQPGLEAARIESLRADRPQAEPGSQVALFVRLNQFRGERTTRKLTVDIPETAEPGTEVNILVADAASSRAIDRRLDPGFFSPQDFEGLMRFLGAMEPNRNLVVRASFTEEGVRYDGRPMPALPSSTMNILRFNRHEGRTTPLVKDIKFSVETPWILSGSQMVTIAVKGRSPGER